MSDSNAIPGRYIYMFMDNKDQITFYVNVDTGSTGVFLPSSASIDIPGPSGDTRFRVSSPCQITDLVLNMPWNNFVSGGTGVNTYERTYVTSFLSFQIYCNGISVDSGFFLQDILMGHCCGKRIIPTYQFLPGYDYQLKVEYDVDISTTSLGDSVVKFETTLGTPLLVGLNAGTSAGKTEACLPFAWGYSNSPLDTENVNNSRITVPASVALVAARIYVDPASQLATPDASYQHLSLGVYVNGVPSNVRIPLDACLWFVGDGIKFPLTFYPGNTYQFYTIVDS